MLGHGYRMVSLTRHIYRMFLWKSWFWGGEKRLGTSEDSMKIESLKSMNIKQTEKAELICCPTKLSKKVKAHFFPGPLPPLRFAAPCQCITPRSRISRWVLYPGQLLNNQFGFVFLCVPFFLFFFLLFCFFFWGGGG